MPNRRRGRTAEEDSARLTAIVSASQQAIAATDLRGRFSDWNAGAQRLYGYTAHEILGQPASILMPPDRTHELEDELERVSRGERVQVAHAVRVHKDGRRIEADISLSPIYDSGHKIVGISVISRDVTAECRGQRRLNRINRLFRAMVQASPMAMILVDFDSTVRMWNRAAERMFGWKEREVLGRPSPVIPESGKDEFRGLCRSVQAGQTVATIDTVRLRRDGSTLEVRLSAAPVANEQGRITSMLVMLEDITDHKAVERALRGSEDRLRRQHKALGDLARTRFEGDLRAAIQRITQVAAGTLGVARAGVWLFDEDRTHLRCVDLYESAPDRHAEGAELVVADYPAYFTAMDQERVIAADDARADPRTREFSDSYLVPLGITSMMDAPVLVHGTLAGVACHEHVGALRRWSSEEQAFAASVADMVASAIEAEQRLRAEEALRAAEQRFRSIFDQATTGIVQVDLTGRFVLANERYCQIVGYPADELYRKRIQDITHPDDLPRHVELFDRLIRDGADFAIDNRYIRPDGTQVWVNSSVSLVRDAQGRPAFVQAVTLDISERKRVDQTLKEHAQTLNILNRLSNAVNGELDLATVVQMVTDAGTELSGAKCGAFINGEEDGALKLCATTGLPGAAAATLPLPNPRELLAPVLGGEKLIRLDDAGGELRSILAAPVLSRTGKVIGGLFFGHPAPGVFTDRAERLIGGLAAHAAVAIDNAQLFRQVQAELEERTKAEKALERLNTTLETRVGERTAELDRRMTQLRALAAQVHRVEQRERARLARILHDHLQQLLVAAMIQLDLASKGRGRSAKAIVEQAGKLVRESIEVSRSLTADLSPPVLFEGSLTAALNWLSRHMSERHSLEVQVDAPEVETPDGLTEERRVLLFQSVRELLFNVVKHAQVDRARMVFCILEDRVEVMVEDEGKGLPPLDQSVQVQGSGFGLMSMRERLEYVGGRLTIDSRPGRYTRVIAAVPLEPATAQAPLAQDPSYSADTAPMPYADAQVGSPNGKRRAGHKKIRVLLADDHKVLRDGLAGLLRVQPWIDVVGEAGNGQEAVDLAGRLLPDVIVMDITMPVLNGIEATRRITGQFPGTRIVGLSMHEEADMTAAMLEAGAETYLTKGGPAEDLIAAIYGKPEPVAEPAAADHA